MSSQSRAQINGLFDQAVQTFTEALSAGVKVNEEVARWWADALDQPGPMREWQKRSGMLVSEAIPAAQKSAQDWLRLMEQNYRRSMGLLQSAFGAEESQASDVQARTQKLWEQSLEALRDSAQATAQANLRMIEAWSQLLKRNFNGAGSGKPETVGTT